MFPHLVAGPLVRAYDILPQLEKAGLPSPEQKWEAFGMISRGYFKKMVIADNIAPLVDIAFQIPDIQGQSSVFWWLVSLLFAYQIYADFSGYSDIARGLARLMGIDFPPNFNHPYAAFTFSGFWRRWHISLSTWFRDYVYFPLGGARVPVWRQHVNLWTTMLMSALWHGANWTFIAWGALHAFYLSIERVLGLERSERQSTARKLIGWIVMTPAVCIAWIYFRAPDITTAGHIVVQMLSFKLQMTDLRALLDYFGMRTLVLTGFYVLWDLGWLLGVQNKLWTRVEPFVPVALGTLLMLAILFRGPGHTFIYFQF